MSDFALTLGGVAFKDFEIPDSIAAGGGQLLQIHKYAGGNRTIDAFGPDDKPITWAGMMLDSDAEARCQQLEAMRIAGQQVELSFSSFSYLVVIRQFDWDFEKFYRIRYAITLEVSQNKTQASSDQGDDPESDIQGDIDDTADYADQLGDSGLSALTDALTTTAGSVSSIVGAPASFLTGFSTQIGTTLDYVSDLVDQADSGIDHLVGIAGGTAPDDMIETLEDAAGNSDTLATAFALKNTLGRLSRNVAAITG